MAAMDGRFSVSLDDIRKVAIPVLRHRISTNFQAQAEGQTTESLIQRLIAEIREPEVPKYDRRGGRRLRRRPEQALREARGRIRESCDTVLGPAIRDAAHGRRPESRTTPWPDTPKST